ncbi:hypothetical protein ABC502_03850 [Alkalimonas sp. NCh-2]|uniref:hypothetical protein n=1 Tax=Alkalimonas sp. NCh-2 TaxID=3144846 RepID=UPI0031F6FC6D
MGFDKIHEAVSSGEVEKFGMLIDSDEMKSGRGKYVVLHNYLLAHYNEEMYNVFYPVFFNNEEAGFMSVSFNYCFSSSPVDYDVYVKLWGVIAENYNDSLSVKDDVFYCINKLSDEGRYLDLYYSRVFFENFSWYSDYLLHEKNALESKIIKLRDMKKGIESIISARSNCPVQVSK